MAPMPVRMHVVDHRAIIFQVARPTVFIVAPLAIASGKLERNTPTTNTNGFREPSVTMNPITRDSGIASSRMPTQIMMAVFLSLFTWSPTAAAISSSSRMLSGTSSGVAVPGAGIAPVSSRTRSAEMRLWWGIFVGVDLVRRARPEALSVLLFLYSVKIVFFFLNIAANSCEILCTLPPCLSLFMLVRPLALCDPSSSPLSSISSASSPT
mmetsp:Transcript_7905/g.18639  ORF Transcript_7905/g.18639 Transcript_7905/m.18639 type:complete len:210 (+) Transcript_7905:494-1123(+)